MKLRRQPSILEESTRCAAAAFVGVLELAFHDERVEEIPIAAGYVARHAPEGHLPPLPSTWEEITERIEALCVRVGRMPGRPVARGPVANERDADEVPPVHPVAQIAEVLAEILAALRAGERQRIARLFEGLPPELEEVAAPRFDLLRENFESHAEELELPAKYPREFRRSLKSLEDAWVNPLLPLDCFAARRIAA